MSAAGLSRKLQRVETVFYAQTPGGRKMEAALPDLPLLVEKYESCLAIPRVKILQLNDLAAISPMNISTTILELIRALSEIGIQPPERVSSNIKNILQTLHAKLNRLMNVEAILKQHEQQLMPLLYEQRFLAIPCIVMRQLGCSVWYLWGCLSLYIILFGALCYRRYRSGKWTKMKVIEEHF